MKETVIPDERSEIRNPAQPLAAEAARLIE
jgi:hypothetical protein